MQWLSDIPDWLWVTFVGLATSIALWWRRQAAGLSFFQEATDEERDKLEQLMRERIDLLEARNAELFDENEILRAALSCEDLDDSAY